MRIRHALLCVLISICFLNCHTPEKAKGSSAKKIRVIFDTDTNNELDDQHALAYLVFNQSTFNIAGITINTTSSGGNIDLQYAEAIRVLQLCNADNFQVLKGADKSYTEILSSMNENSYDGKPAVDFIIKTALESSKEKLVIIAVGKLSNIALALAKNPSIENKVRLVWLGSNYPEPGEHNQNNDTVAMNFLLNSKMDFEMVTVRYGKSSGTDAVKVTKADIQKMMPGAGPHIKNPVIGRHGGTFYCFGDYSVDLFAHVEYYGDPPSRALFDMAAVAIVKNPAWAHVYEHQAPIYNNGQWVERLQNQRKIKIWENFDKDAIIADLAKSMQVK